MKNTGRQSRETVIRFAPDLITFVRFLWSQNQLLENDIQQRGRVQTFQ